MKYICLDCIGDSFLKEKLVDEQINYLCTYCSTKTAVFAIDKVAIEVRKAFHKHFTVKTFLWEPLFNL